MNAPLTIFITGATGGFGQAFAQRFAALDCRFILHGRDAARLETLAADIETTYGRPVYRLIADLRDPAALQAALDALPDDWRTIDLLLNNAGLALGLEGAQKADLEDWTTMIAVNNTALVTISHFVLPLMVARGRGHIINIASTAGNYPYPGGNVYCASKAFVKQFSLALRADLHGTNIRVTNLEPGMAETNFSVLRFKGDTDKAANVYKGMTPLSGKDVAEAAFWVFSQPAHVNINRMEIMPVAQSFGPLPVARDTP